MTENDNLGPTLHESDGGGRNDESFAATSTCLTPKELDAFAHSGNLPLDKIDHVENCQVCDGLISQVHCPPNIDGFLLNLSETKTPTQPPSVSSKTSQYRAAAAVSLVLFGVCLALLFHISALKTEFAQELSDLETKSASRMSLEAGADYNEDAMTPLRMQELEAEARERDVRQWTREMIQAWLYRGSGMENNDLEYLFDHCAEIGMDCAVPRAVLFAKAKVSREMPHNHIWAARRFLADYTDEEIIGLIQYYAAFYGRSIDTLLGQFEKYKDRVRNLDGWDRDD